MQQIYKTQFAVDQVHVDRFGRLRPSMMLRFAQEVAGDHSAALSMSYEELAARGLFWAVVRTRLQVSRTPMLGQTLALETWPMPTTRTAFPRSVVAYDQEGREAFRAVSLWVLMDLEQRTMVLPSKTDIVVDGLLRGGELALPRAVAPHALDQEDRRRVCFTDLDRNGHMNNARYLDWIDDLLPSVFHRDASLHDMTLSYINEALEGQTLAVGYGFEGEALHVDIHRPEDGHRIFAAQLHYGMIK